MDRLLVVDRTVDMLGSRCVFTWGAGVRVGSLAVDPRETLVIVGCV